MRGRNRQAGFVLMLVMLTVAMAVVLGMSYAYSASIKLASSDNLLHANRAKYLAESGLQHGMYAIWTNPEAVVASANAWGPFQADESGDSYLFTVVEDPDVSGQYIVTAQATSGGITQSCSAVVEPTWPAMLNNAVFVTTGSAVLPPGLTVNGNMFINGSLNNLATIIGSVSATGTVSDVTNGISGTITEYAAAQQSRTIQWSDYQQYYVSGVAYTATHHTKNDLRGGDSVVKKGAITPENVAGVVWLDPPKEEKPAKIKDKVDFTGTIITDCDLILDGKKIVLTAVEGFPALVVNGRLIIKEDAQATINGLVVATQGIVSEKDTKKSKTVINGALLCDERGYDVTLKGEHVLNYSANRCRIYDVSGGE